MSAPATVLLDNEAVQALLDVSHPKHKRVMSFVDELNSRGQRRGSRTVIEVPVAVRVEAGWDRSSPTSAGVNRFSRARDVVLDGPAADRATQLRQAVGVSVVDATVGQAAQVAASPAVIVTSDVSDMHRLVGTGTRVIRI